MKDEKKYYTPTIEEFHVGFECERFSHLSGKWESFVIDQFGLHEILNEELEGTSEHHLRVKYLDREDIESLGWEIKQPYNKKCETFYFTNSNIENEPYIEMDVYEDSKVYINNADYYECHKCFFSGTIRNKSELRRLMRQLGILDYNKEGDGKK